MDNKKIQSLEQTVKDLAASNKTLKTKLSKQTAKLTKHVETMDKIIPKFESDMTDIINSINNANKFIQGIDTAAFAAILTVVQDGSATKEVTADDVRNARDYIDSMREPVSDAVAEIRGEEEKEEEAAEAELVEKLKEDAKSQDN